MEQMEQLENKANEELKELDKIKKYLVIEYEPLEDKFYFDILETKLERGTEEFEELIEEYQNNNNSVHIAELTEENKKAVLEVADKIKKD